jgi:cytochrome c peroxidase
MNFRLLPSCLSGLVAATLLTVAVGGVRAEQKKPAAPPAAAPPQTLDEDVEPRDLPAFLGPLPPVKAPKDNPQTDAKIELGRMLYHDPRLSGNGAVSCATCHNPALGFSDGQALSVGINGTVLGRSSPTVLNAAHYKLQFWDGRAATLEDQAKGPLLNPNEMKGDAASMVRSVAHLRGYRELFQKVFGSEPTFDRIADAIAAFERICVDLDSPFDRYARGDDTAISEQAVRGLGVFTLQGACASCHSGPNFSDSKFHNIGVNPAKDEGRYAISKDPRDKGAFKTPTLRNVALTGPFMHDGSLKTLREVIDHYVDAPRRPENKGKLSILMPEITLTEQEKDDLEAFLKTLTGDKRDPRIFQVPQLPQE